jgi:hypothetical protein
MVNTHMGNLVAGVRATEIKKKLFGDDAMVFLAIDEKLHRLEYYEYVGDEDKCELVRLLTLNPNLNSIPKPEPEPLH